MQQSEICYVLSIEMSSKQDIAAWQRELYHGHYRRIYNTCLRIVGDSMEAEEAMHDTFMKLFAKMDRTNQPENFYAWSKSIAVNTAIDRVRKRKMPVVPVDNLQIIEDDPVDEESIRLEVEKINRKLADLPDGYRVVLSMHLFEGYDFEEMAQILNLKEASVRSQFSRGRQKLLQLIQEDSIYGQAENIH